MIQPCSERVLLQLTNHYSAYIVPLLSEVFRQSAGPFVLATFLNHKPHDLVNAVIPAVDLNSVIEKEAIYCAFGRCAHRLKNEIPFDQWLQHTLAVEAKEPTNPRYCPISPADHFLKRFNSYPIIKRRIAWLIGKWVSEECTPPTNPLIWDVLAHLIKDRGPSTDTVVRLTAATAIKDCMDVGKKSLCS
jgi:hypothetical protein